MLTVLKQQFDMEQHVARSFYKLPYLRGFWFPIWASMQRENPKSNV